MVPITSDKVRKIVQEVRSAVSGIPLRADGLPQSFKAFLTVSIAGALRRPVVLITPTSEESEKWMPDLQFFLDFLGVEKQILTFPSLEIVPYEQVAPPPAILAERTRTIGALIESKGSEGFLIVAPSQAFFQRIPPSENVRAAALTLLLYESVNKEELLDKLQELGFEPASMIESPGEFSHRGGIVDFWPAEKELPVRLELEGDLIESLRDFNPFDQRSVASRESIKVWPILGKKEGTTRRGNPASFISYLPGGTLVILDEPERVEREMVEFDGAIFEYYAEALDHHRPIQSPDLLYHCAQSLLKEIKSFPSLHLSGLAFDHARNPNASFSFSVRTPVQLGLGLPGVPFDKIAGRLNALREKETIFLVSHSENQLTRLGEICLEHRLPAGRFAGSGSSPASASSLFLVKGSLSSGFQDEDSAIAFLTEEDLFGKALRARPAARRKGGAFISSFEDLKVHDLVVHAHHGIGKYLGLKHLTFDGVTSDFLEIEYKGRDKIFVPLDSLELISKYSGIEGSVPVLDRLGGSAWANRMQRVRKSVERMTREILELYASREVTRGYAFSPEDEMSREFAATFEYEETPDQLRAIEDVVRDMEDSRPMDRLICGDVGYGKTEIAMRAAFKAVKDNKQVLILVPTTLLAQQHFANFRKRFAPFPVRIDVLSRFRSPREQKSILREMAEGTIDILIGTHRLLQKDFQFRDLGLLVVDEEQRFGVLHKEKLKQVKKSIDVLTLTATPIPRTLQMSLMNIRNMSVIETAPADRLAIRTVLTHFDRRVIREAIKRELDRNGQIFFVHNRVTGIEKIGHLIGELVPEATAQIAHGQMNEHQLEAVMRKFVEGEFQILISTTIIESGLDIPRANTIIINRADHFGLSELYQLRGRVGRSGQQAYAFLLVDDKAGLTEQAQKRLRALQEFTELGAGFKIAARDLEIRGAGHFLGTQQSGEIASVGFELYIKMLENSVSELRGTEIEPEFSPVIQLGISAYLPETYIPDSYQRLYFYKKLSSIAEETAILDIESDLRDRFGPVPEEVSLLFLLIRVRILAKQLKIGRIEKNAGGVCFRLLPRHEISTETILRLTRDKRIRLIPEDSFQLLLKAADPRSLLDQVVGLLRTL